MNTENVNNKDKQQEGLPTVSRGVGGAGRVSGLLTSGKTKDAKKLFLDYLKT